ncbi:hypothetical protein [Aridibaculum aurantiacum]|uniref:hypothetical protein n=1 Tax=Aridibaculum aurantiacum TaxID=2810307 RepID=UPI001A9795C2|nr:hypothetical protein [Aridibaculum aurantiacum]
MQIQDFQTSVAESISYLSIVANNIGKLTLKIFDTNGFIAKTISTQIAQGAQLLDINLGDLNEGTYIINAFNGDEFLKAFRITK